MQARAALIYLEGEFEAEIPHHYLNKFKTYKPSLSERILFNHAVHKGWQFDNPTGFVETVKMHYFIHLRQSIQYNFLIQHLSFIAYTVRLFLDTPVFFVSRFTRLFFNMFR